MTAIDRQNPLERALWCVETRFAGPLTLDDIAETAGVSRFHLSRLFALVIGRPVMDYVKARRLSVAARALADSGSDILTIALEAGYGSHEAFTRAFRDQFGTTPDQARKPGVIDTFPLQEALRMPTTATAPALKPRIVEGKALLIAGINERYGCGPGAGIPAQWQRFGPHIGALPGEVRGVTYGVIHNSDDTAGFDYLCGVEVADFAQVPPELDRLRISPHLYAVFSHEGHVSAISATIQAIWSTWLPNSDYEAQDAPNFERYGPQFNGMTGMGGLEFWVAVKPKPARP